MKDNKEKNNSWWILWGVIIALVITIIGSLILFYINPFAIKEYLLQPTDLAAVQPDINRIYDIRIRAISSYIASVLVIFGIVFTIIRMRQTDKRLQQNEKQIENTNRQLELNQKQLENTSKQLELSEGARLDTRFKDAVTLLGNESRTVRIGGLYTLLEIAKSESAKMIASEQAGDNPAYQSSYPRQVVEMVCSFIRIQSQKDYISFIKDGKNILETKNVSLKDNPEHYYQVVDIITGNIREKKFVDLEDAIYMSIKHDFGEYVKEYQTHDDLQIALNILFLNHINNFVWANLEKEFRESGDTKRKKDIRERQKNIAIKARKEMFYGVEVNNFNLENSYLLKVSLEHACLNDVKFNSAYLQQTKFNMANLENIELRACLLMKTSFDFANLSGADFSNAKLNGARFWDTFFFKTIFWEADLCNNFLLNTNFNIKDNYIKGMIINEKTNFNNKQLEAEIKDKIQRKIIIFQKD